MMRALAAILLGALLAVPDAPARAAPAGLACAAPDEPVLAPLALPLAKASMARGGRLVILGLGGAPMAGAAAQGDEWTYLSRLRVHLAALLPGVEITMANHGVARRSAQGMLRRLADDLKQVRPGLVLWESGGREAVSGLDSGLYARTLEAGVQQMREAGADVLLLDTQFAPGYAGLVNLTPYRENLRAVAEMTATALFPRYELMRAWNEAGTVDLEAQDPAAQLAATRKLFDCLGQRMAAAIAAALR